MRLLKAKAARLRYPRFVTTLRIFGVVLLSFLCASAVSRSQQSASPTQPAAPDLLAGLTADFNRLAPQTVQPAQGYIHHPFLVPAGYYPQMWDWDGFFIGSHWANQDPSNAKYLRDWVLSFASSADADGYVAGCITPKVRGRSSANLP